MTLNRFESADNIDLPLIFHDFEEYYEMKFGKKPMLTRRNELEDDDDTRFARSSLSKGATVRRNKSEMEAKKRKELREKANNRGSGGSGVLATMEQKLGVDTTTNSSAMMSRSASSPVVGLGIDNNANNDNSDNNKENVGMGMGLSGTTVTLQDKRNLYKTHEETPMYAQKLLKPLPSFGGDGELRQLGETITRDILQTSPGVVWKDVIQLDNAKKLLKEAVVMPLKYPQLFTGLLSPWCGILLVSERQNCYTWLHPLLN